MNEPIIQKTITVQEIQPGDGKSTVKSSEGERFSVWYTKKDGTPSQASITMQSLGLRSGSVVDVSYVEVPYTDKKGMPRIGLNVKSFRPATGAPTPTKAAPAPSPSVSGEVLGTQGIFQAMIASGNVPLEQTPEAWDVLIKRAHALTKKIRATVDGTPSFEESLKDSEAQIENEEDEIDVEGIPF